MDAYHPQRYEKEIIKHLERVTATGYGNSQVFDDWLDIIEATLEALPGHLRAAKEGVTYQDTPETQAIFDRAKARYSRGEYLTHFQAAFAALLESTAEWNDTIGGVYMAFGHPNSGTGQYFTPWNVAKMMAEMSMIEPMLHDRMKEAIGKDPAATAMLLAGMVIKDPDEAQAWYFNKILPAAAPHFETITVCDPCVGSGVMLLASASTLPRWALDWGLVQFYGMDIDLTCVKMARINAMMYGLNGFSLKCAVEMTPAEIHALPEPYAAAYTEAQADPERALEIAAELRSYKQASFL